jgi:hypothetical protein
MRTRFALALIALALLGSPVGAQQLSQQERLSALLRQLGALLEEIAETLAPAAPTPAPLHIGADGDLQAAVDAALPGTTITLDAGAEYVGTLTLPLKACDPVTTITTARFVAPAGTRVDPSWAGRLAILRSGSVEPAIRFAEGTCGWAIRGLQFLPNERGQHEVIEIGKAWDTKTLAGLPRDVFLSHLLMDFPSEQRRGIGLNGINVIVEYSWIAGARLAGQDSQALAGWNTPGPIAIRWNHLEAGSEVILFGGADPGVENIVPCDISVEGNTLTRPAAWLTGPTSTYVVKSLFQLKAGCRVVVRDNLMFHHWQAAQPGWAIVLTPRNQGGRCTACRIEDVVFERNVIHSVSGGFSILDTDNVNPSGRAQRITIRDNWIRIDHRVWPGPGRPFQILGAVADLAIEHNTIEHTGTYWIGGDGAPAPGFHFVRNLVVPSGAYGIFATAADGQNYAHGLRWQEHFPGGVITENAIAGWAGSAATRANLPGNLFVAPEQATLEDGYGTGVVAGYGRRRNGAH